MRWLYALALVALAIVPVPAQSARQVRHGYGWWYTTAYLATGYRTATGVWPYYGGVAVDPSVIPLGAMVHVVGLGVFRADDTGGAVWGRHLDFFARSMAEAYRLQGSQHRLAYWTEN